MKPTYPRADGIVAVSSGVADDLAASIGLPRPRINVVYNPAFTIELCRQASDIPTHPWFEPGQPPVVLGIGRLEPQKSFVTLIEAFAQMRHTRNVRLIILGEGYLRSTLEQQVQTLDLQASVCLPGFVENPFVYMRHAALFVLSSGWEGLGNVLIEAMACGTPVVSTDCPSGPAEILQNGRWGRIVPVGDSKALAIAMAATLDETEHPDVAMRATEFNVDKAVDSYLRVMLPNE